MTREPQALLTTFAARLEEARAYLPPDSPFDRLIGLQGEETEPRAAQSSCEPLGPLRAPKGRNRRWHAENLRWDHVSVSHSSSTRIL